MRYKLPAPNTVIEVSAQDDSFNLVDMFFVDKILAEDEGLIYCYLIRSDYARDKGDFGAPNKVNLAGREWQYVDSPPTSVLGDAPERQPLNRVTTLITASNLISGDRAETYGAPRPSFTRIGQLWGAMLNLGSIMPEMVALMLVQLKVSRIISSPDHEDSWVDAAGYIGLGAEMALEEN